MAADEYRWWRDGVFYQIYPRSFADSDQDGIGDLNGITAKLDYLVDLGIDAIWLSPIYPSPDIDFGYDISDFTAIHPQFGTLQDFDHLVAEAHQRKIRVILELVLNHTSDQHPWFQQSRSSRDNPYRDWYLWRDGRADGGYPNNWASVFGGPGWEYDSQTGQYFFHMFYPQQPDVNWRNPEVRQAMLDVFRFWLERGVDGFRLDVFNAYFKDAEFRNNPPQPGVRRFEMQDHIYDINQPEMIQLLKEIRQIMDEYPDRYVVGEPFMDNPKLAAQYCEPGLLHAAFNFEMIQCRWRPGSFLKMIQRWENALSPDTWPNYVMNNHNHPRSATRWGRGEKDDRLKVAATLLLTLRGTPFMYYGEEIGMRDISIKRSEIRDSVGLQYWPIFKGRDGCRTPMQWDGSENAGFSSTTPWLRIHQDYEWRNVAAQQTDPESLLNFYRRLIVLRKQIPALRQGMLQPLTYEPRRILAFLRQTSRQTVLIALNFSRFSMRLVLGGSLGRDTWQMLLSNKRQEPPRVTTGLLPLLPEEALILIQR